MELRLKAKNEQCIKGFETLEKHSRGMLTKRLIKTSWGKEDHSIIIITPQHGVKMQKGKKAKNEVIGRLKLYLSSVCKLSKNDYEVL